MKKVIIGLAIVMASNVFAMKEDRRYMLQLISEARKIDEEKEEAHKRQISDELEKLLAENSYPREISEECNDCGLDPASVPSDILEKAIRLTKIGREAE